MERPAHLGNGSTDGKGRLPGFAAALLLAVLFVAVWPGGQAEAAVSRGPEDTKALVTQGRVDVVFTPLPSVSYAVYRHVYGDGHGATRYAWATTDAAGRIVTASVYPVGAWKDNSEEFPGKLVFSDTAITDYQEYYYFVVDGNYSGQLQDYVVTAAFPPVQTRHGNFTEYTGACTTCHGLHSALNQKLLKAPTVVGLCGSCHDGTGSKYNEVNGWVRVGASWAQRTDALAGPFGGVLSAGAMVTPTSVHNVGQAITNQAPGSGHPSDPSTWTSTLTCISCHEPHNLFKNYRLLKSKIHQGTEVRVRGFSEVYWTATDRTDAVTVQQYVYGVNNFCGQCHIYFNDVRLGNVDKTPSDPTVAQNVYGKHRHPVGISPESYGSLAVDWAMNGYQYPFDDARPLTTTLPLEGSYTGADGNKNVIVCMTCHMAHGTLKVGLKAVTYLNGALNGTAGITSSTSDPHWDAAAGYTNRYDAVVRSVYGSSVLFRRDYMGVCMDCHQKNFVPDHTYEPN